MKAKIFYILLVIFNLTAFLQANSLTACKNVGAIFSSSQLQNIATQMFPRFDTKLNLNRAEAPEITSVRVLAVCSSSVPNCEMIAPNQSSTQDEHKGKICVYTASMGYGEHQAYFKGFNIPFINKEGLSVKNKVVGWIHTWGIQGGGGQFEYRAFSNIQQPLKVFLNIR